jgi:hypothetical protein
MLWLLCAACGKVPVVDVAAGFSLADAAWFEEEETLFVFFRVDAEQGLGPASLIEVTYRTDDEEVPWTPVSNLAQVHTHVEVDCGPKSLCGSSSVRVRKPPRAVAVRLRYHRDGAMTLVARPLTFNVVGRGAAHLARSLLVYGVFDEENTHVQWRARHQFPTLRNEQVQALGLRRRFLISEARHGALGPSNPSNPYGYAFAGACPSTLPTLDWPTLETDERARFEARGLPLSAATSSGVCATSTVFDAVHAFAAPAVGLKNPEVRPAFPSLRSPISENQQLAFLLRPCDRTISEPHLQMQRQRLLLTGAEEVCTESWRDDDFIPGLATRFRRRIDEARQAGQDMVLTLAIHHDETTGAFADSLEQALELVLPFERDKSSPRVSGAFVFDSLARTTKRPALRRLVLWCPALLNIGRLEDIPDEAERSCPLLPDFPDLKLGPFKFSTLPILPTREQYLNFIEKYSDAQSGRMRELKFLAPKRTPVSENVPIGDFGLATFFNNEWIAAAASDSFSYCSAEDSRGSAVVFRVPAAPDPFPLAVLPQVHEMFPQSSYALGLLWDSPFLLRLKYETSIAGAATAFSLTVPFGVSAVTNTTYGSAQWEASEVDLRQALLQCTRFCDHPTFDSSGVYNVGAPFRTSYGAVCYRPKFPVVGEGGFPIDP